jgi:hypothetical protein
MSQELTKHSGKKRSDRRRRSGQRPSGRAESAIPVTHSRIGQEEMPRRQYGGESAMSIPRASPTGQQRGQRRHRGSRRKHKSKIMYQYNRLFDQMHADHRITNPIAIRQQTDEEIKTAELRRSIAERLRTVDEGSLALISELLGDDPSSFNVSKMIGTRDYRSTSNGKTYLNGLLHSFDDQPAEVTSWMGQLRHYWYKNGKLHRDNGPAHVVKNQYGNVTLEEIWKNGKMISSQFHPGHYYGDDDNDYGSDSRDY